MARERRRQPGRRGQVRDPRDRADVWNGERAGEDPERGIPAVLPNLIEELQGQKVNGFGLKDGGCPIGTVPILRTNPNSHWGEDAPPPQSNLLNCVAGVQLNNDVSNNNTLFYGATGTLVLYKPRVYNDNQYSSTRIKLSYGDDSLEAGWMVSPKLFNDTEAHLYVRFLLAKQGGCVNLQCPGFVQVAPDAPLGTTPDTYSIIGGQQRFWNFSIEKHKDDGNWWLNVAQVNKAIGYWPKEIFTTLADVANKVEWGGQVYDFGSTDPPSPSTLPDMGSGVKGLYTSRSSSAAIYRATYLDENYVNVALPGNPTKVMNCYPNYTVLDDGYSPDFGRTIYYGGVQDK
uniref:Neprosin PEP catalytic domain-containing protein n=1 Tax=Chenopodium quinoa TaxID=63459 RepID=A0A803LHN9_CHEQI